MAGVMATGMFGLHKPGNAVEVNDVLTWEEVRKLFPLQDARTYLNNGTFGPSPFPVLEEIQKQFIQSNTSGEYGHTDSYRKILAEFVGATAKEISLTHNTTEGINIVCWGIPLKEGDEVITSLHEHVGNALPWLNRAKLQGIVLKPIEPGKTADETLSRIKNAITSKTRVLALPHITCTTGQVFPLREIVQLAKEHDLYTAIDGAHGPGTLNLDLRELGVDFYASSCHKWMLGPNGTGFVYINENRLDELQAYQVGAYSDAGWDLYANPPVLHGYNPDAHRFDYGSQSMPLYAGAAASAQFHSTLGKDRVESRIRELNDYLLSGLLDLGNRYEILTPLEALSRVNMISFRSAKRDYKEIAGVLSDNKFRIRMVPESGLNAIRISTHIYNSKQELDRVLATLKDA